MKPSRVHKCSQELSLSAVLRGIILRVMPRRRLSPEAIRAALNIECLHCHAVLGPAEQLRIDGEHLRCPKCQKEFVPKGPEEVDSD